MMKIKIVGKNLPAEINFSQRENHFSHKWENAKCALETILQWLETNFLYKFSSISILFSNLLLNR